MKAKGRSRDRKPKTPLLRPVAEARERHAESPTAVAAEAWRTGVLPLHVNPRRVEGPGSEETLLFGDPDDDTLANAYVGEETPGGSTPTPDQSIVDEIGRAYGLQESDTGALRSASEVLERRDRRRNELQPPRKPQP
jgi:hypothetical protein